MAIDRRTFLQLLSTTRLPQRSGKHQSSAEDSAHRITGTIADVEHIVIMMQENVRSTITSAPSGCADLAIASSHLSTGNSVWISLMAVYVYRSIGSAEPRLQFLEDLAHDWTTTHALE